MRHILTLVYAALRRGVRSLTVQFTVALVLLAFLPTCVLVWAALIGIGSASRETAARASATTAKATATTLVAYVDAAANNLIAFADALSAAPNLDHSIDPQLRRFLIDYPHFRHATLVGADHRVLATSAIVGPRDTLTPWPAAARIEGVTLTTVTLDDALLPTAQLLVPVAGDTPATLVADFSLERLWRAVQTLELPPGAQAILVDERARVLAHSDPAYQSAVARGLDLHQHPLLQPAAGSTTIYTTPAGVEWLATAAPLTPLHWTLLIEQPTRAIDQPALSARHQLTAVLLLILACTTLALVFVGRSLTTPLQTLTRATHALAEGGPKTQVPIPGHEELANLARAFNFLVERLSVLETTVRRQEREAVLGQISGGLLHDLAHPIRNIVNNARLLPRLTESARHDCLQLIEREYATIDELFDNLKDFGRTLPAQWQLVPLPRVMQEIATLLRYDAETRGVTLRIADPPPLPPVMTDGGALRRILRNLTVNAIEAAQATGGTVTLSVEAASDTLVHLTVRDTGPGLSGDRLATLFDGFQSSKRKGLGLGLATAKRLVEQVGGTLTATSTVGVGTACVIALPIKDAES
jgi:two-component system, NtrC family, sensor kinase